MALMMRARCASTAWKSSRRCASARCLAPYTVPIEHRADWGHGGADKRIRNPLFRQMADPLRQRADASEGSLFSTQVSMRQPFAGHRRSRCIAQLHEG